MPGFPCCCNDCTIFVDTFNRPNTSELGEDWVSNGTQFSIEDNAAKPNSSFAIAILDVPHIVPDESMHVIITTKDEIANSGTRYRVILNSQRTATPTSYYFAEFERRGTNDSILRIGICSNNVDTILAQDVVLGLLGFSRQIEARLATYEFCATVSNSTVSYVATQPVGLFPQGYYCGMSVYSSAALIDDITFKEHFETNQNCAFCSCRCQTTYLPPVLKVCIYPIPPNCTRLDLLAPFACFNIFWNRINGGWQGQGMSCQSYTYNSGQLWEVSIACPSNFEDPYTIPLNILQGCTNSCGASCQGAIFPAEATCTPFKLRYGPFRVEATDLTCLCSSSTDIFGRGYCDYYIEITFP
jgi:hypothetical protein